MHQTFVNIYERDAVVLQAILARDRQQVEFFPGTTQGTLAVIRRFAASGVHHILIGPDHLLFLIGLLLLGGSLRQLVLVVSAFTVAHSITLSLAVFRVLAPPAWLIEPAIALSIVYVGADNLTVRGGRDMRAWIAFAFGLIHGFGFASVLREMELPPRALGWSLLSFNLGVEAGQLLVVIPVASALALIRAQERARRAAAGGCRIGRGDSRRRLLVHPARLVLNRCSAGRARRHWKVIGWPRSGSRHPNRMQAFRHTHPGKSSALASWRISGRVRP